MQFEKMSFAFQFVPANFLFDKPSSLLNFTKEKAVGRIRHFESFFSKLKMNLYNRQSRQNFSSISYRSLNIFKALRDKLKRD